MAELKPQKREADVRIEEFLGELLVYDLRAHRAHSLNATAAAIWRACDGTATVEEIAARATAATRTPLDESLVLHALNDLAGASLLDTPIDVEVPDASRRRALTQLAWAAAIPLVLSIAMPTPSYAQTGPPGATGPGPTGATGPTGGTS